HWRAAPAVERASRRDEPGRAATPNSGRGRAVRRLAPPTPRGRARPDRSVAGERPKRAEPRRGGHAGHLLHRELAAESRHPDSRADDSRRPRGGRGILSPLTQNGAPRPRVALVHDYLNQYGGAERVIEALHELFPEAPVFTSLYDPAAMPARYRTWDIRTSFLQRIPAARRFHRSLLLLYPMAFEAFDLRQFDVVISNSSAWAKSVITGPATTHICYCLTPMRWAWNYAEYGEREGLGKATRAVLPAAIHYLRLWDVATAKRVDRFVGISRAVVARIGKYYGRAADLIPPPVDVADAELSTSHSDQFLVVS